MLFRLSLILLITASPLVAAVARDSIVALPSRPAVIQRFILMEPDLPPRAVVVAWPSGDGVIGLTESGMTHSVAFFPRASARFVAAGIALAIADVPSDKSDGLDYDFRLRPEHMADVAAVVTAVQARIKAPVFLAGFSRGTLSVANAAAHLGPHAAAGLILASSVTVRAGIARHTVHDAPLGEIRVPVLLLNHRDDDCMLTPTSGLPALLQALVAAPRKETRVLIGGSVGSGGCFAHTPHDFLGVEDQAVTSISNWIDNVLAGNR